MAKSEKVGATSQKEKVFDLALQGLVRIYKNILDREESLTCAQHSPRKSGVCKTVDYGLWLSEMEGEKASKGMLGSSCEGMGG